MATTSEIQVTEAYIGLLGRAPDPAGLAYWAKQLDDAIAAGEDAAVALKKLTNDITLSAEWDAGIGAQDASTQSGADSIVASMYTNLFGRAATTADKAYWSAELVAGTTTASEMAVQLIQGASTTDAGTLGFKQEAATYYVETVVQADFNKTNAASAVSSVDSPLSLQTSKDATDALATGAGSSLVVGTDTITMTLGDDTVTGDVKAGAYVDDTTEVSDASTSDADTLTLAATGDFAFGTTNNVETININAATSFGDEFDIDFAKVDNDTGTVNVTTAPTVTIAGVEVGGQQDIDLENVRSDVNTTTVQDVDIDFDSNAAVENVAHTVTVDATADTINITGANDAGITLIMANDAAGSQSVTIAGEDGTNDAVTISANNTVALDLNQTVANATLSGNTNEVTYTITNTDNAVVTDSTITLTGSQNITIKADADELTGSNLVNSATGTETINVTASTGTALDLSKAALVDNLELSFDASGDTVTVKSGQAVELSANQSGTLIIEEAGTAAAGGSLAITLDGGTDSAFTAGEINTDHFEALSVNAGNNTVTGLIIDTGDQAGNDADVTIVGTNDITFADSGGESIDAAAENVTVNAKSVTLSGDIGGNDISVTATSGVISAAGQNIVAVDGGSITLSATGPVTAATVHVDVADIDAGEDIVISGNDVDITSTIKAHDVTLTATNDSETSTLGGALTVGGDLKFTDGGWDVNAAVGVTGTLTISGDAEVDVAGGVVTAAAGVVITSTNDVDFEGTLITPVLNAASASGAISVDFDGNTAAVTSLTGSGNDTIELDDAVVFTVNSGDGVDTITVTDVAAGTVINSAGGADTIDDNDDGVVFTVSTGAGNDNISVVDGSDATYDAGDDYDTLTIAAGTYQDDTFLFKNVEKVVLGGGVTIDSAQLDNDNTFLMSGAQTLTVLAEAADTVDLSNITFDPNAIGNFTITGSAGADTIIGSAVVDNLDPGAGNDTITLGTGIDHINYTTGADGVDTVTDFTSGTDQYETNFQTSGKNNAGADQNYVVQTAAVNTGAALALNTDAADVEQITGVTLSVADAADEAKVIAAISNGTITIHTAQDKAMLSVVTSTHTFLYEVTEVGNNTNITAADDTIVLVGIFTNAVQFATGDID